MDEVGDYPPRLERSPSVIKTLIAPDADVELEVIQETENSLRLRKGQFAARALMRSARTQAEVVSIGHHQPPHTRMSQRNP